MQKNIKEHYRLTMSALILATLINIVVAISGVQLAAKHEENDNLIMLINNQQVLANQMRDFIISEPRSSIDNVERLNFIAAYAKFVANANALKNGGNIEGLTIAALSKLDIKDDKRQLLNKAMSTWEQFATAVQPLLHHASIETVKLRLPSTNSFLTEDLNAVLTRETGLVQHNIVNLIYFDSIFTLLILIATVCIYYLRLRRTQPHETMRHTIDQIAVPVLVLDINEKILTANLAAARLFGTDAETIEGHFMSEVLREEDGILTGEKADGSPLLVQQLTSETLLKSNSSPLVITLLDVSDLRAYEGRVEQLSNRDPLTRLPNRRLLIDRLNITIARASRDGQEVGVLLIDLSDIKAVDDRFGHGLTEKTFITIAARLNERIRSGETIARIGTYEFVAVLGPGRREDFHTAKLRMTSAFDTSFEVFNQQLTVKSRTGFAIFPDDGRGAEALLMSADANIYES